jgi:hypothetical protein
MKSPINLFYNLLPQVLQSEIYQYDTTYRIYNTNTFKNEILDIFITLPSTKRRCIQEITEYLNSFIYEGAYWYNEYGRIDTDDSHKYKLTNYYSTDEFFVYLHPIGDVIYYKILPKDSTLDNCPFLRKPNNFDGYFLDKYKNTQCVKYEYDKLCLGKDTTLITAHDPRNNMKAFDSRILMYFA